MSDPKVSIIIPVYNVEKYLRQCLDSAKNQTLQQIEIICIDDGSTDSSGTICDEYASKDSRFVVIHQANAGQSVVRNKGIDLAKGDYIAFLDSDDWLDKAICEKCYEKIVQTDSDIAFTLFKWIGGYQHKRRKISVDVFETELERFQTVELRYHTVWGGLYKRKFLQNNAIYFQSGVNYEDVHYSIKAALMAKRICCIDQPMYYYRIGVGYSYDPHQILKRMTMIEMFAGMDLDFRSMTISPEIRDQILLFKLKSLSHFYRRNVPRSLREECYNRINKAISDQDWERIENGTLKLPLKLRLFYYWFKGGWKNVIKRFFS